MTWLRALAGRSVLACISVFACAALSAVGMLSAEESPSEIGPSPFLSDERIDSDSSHSSVLRLPPIPKTPLSRSSRRAGFRTASSTVVGRKRKSKLALAAAAESEDEMDDPVIAERIFDEESESDIVTPSDAERIEHLEEQISLLRSVAGDDALPADVQPNNREPLPDNGSRLSELEQGLAALADQIKALTNPSKKDEYPWAKVTGFTQLDGAWFSQSQKNIATVGDAQDGVGFRRARFAVVGKAAESTNYMLEVDFATAGRPSFFDVWVDQSNLPYLGVVRAGQYVQPFSVDAVSGFRHLVFLERSLPFLAFVPFRRVGVQAANSTEDEYTNWAYSVFRTGGFNNAPLGDDRFATDFGNKGGYSFSTRVTQLLMYDEESDGCCAFHIGASYDFSQLTGNNATGSTSSVPFYQARTGPEFFLGYPENVPATFGPASAAAGTPNFVDTGRYAASFFNMFGVETVYQNGPMSFQAEWMGTVVQSVVGPIFYNGAYGQIAYRLTGESRVYYKRLAALGNAIPYNDFSPTRRDGIHGWGAWEIAGRWSFVDLNNPASLNGHYISNTNASGNGILNDSTLGVTWFMNAHTKLQFNWIHAFLNNTAKGHSQADLFVSRIQVDF